MTDTLPEVEEVKRKLLNSLVAYDPIYTKGVTGPRSRELATLISRTTDAIDQLQRDNAALREGLEREREALRVLMLDQPNSGERRTYSDGFAWGLCYAIERIDALLNPSNTGGW